MPANGTIRAAVPRRRAALLGGALLAAVAAAPATAGAAPTSIAPAIQGKFADPSFLPTPNGVYAYATGNGFPVATAPTIQGSAWTVRGKSMPTQPRWSGPDENGSHRDWAPHVFVNGEGRSVMYFTARRKRGGNQCVGVATAAAPIGPFRAHSKPLACADGNAIDASSFVGSDGRRYVFWKVNLGGVYEIRVAPMGRRGLVRTGRVRTLIRTDGAIIEAPDVIRRGGRLYMFVARHGYTGCRYSTEVWTATSVLARKWRRQTTLMTTRGTGLCGPGGVEVEPIGNQLWMVFHAWHHHGRPDQQRWMYTGRVAWRGGVPYVP